MTKDKTVTMSRDTLNRWLNEPLSKQHFDEISAILAAPVVERQDEQQMACMPVERCYDVRAKMIIAFNESGKAGGDLDDGLDAAYKAALRYSPNPLLASPPAPVAVVQQCKIGIYGKAYDAPETKRAYTYEDQPDNLGAHKLGQAAIAASLTRGGDLIDSGLSLLRSLHGEGFGVFEIDACLDKVKEMNQ